MTTMVDKHFSTKLSHFAEVVCWLDDGIQTTRTVVIIVNINCEAHKEQVCPLVTLVLTGKDHYNGTYCFETVNRGQSLEDTP